MNYKALSLFCSAGIAETYFEEHGIDVKVAAELLPERVAIYKHNHPTTNIICGDLNDKEIYKNVISNARIEGCDFIVATPPCQGMSTAGKLLKDDPRNQLIRIVINAIQDLAPKFVIIENVPGILTTSIKIGETWVNINDLIYKELGDKYFINENKIVNAMHYGVPQSRERCIYLLAKKDERIKWEFPPKFPHVLTMRDAIGDLPSLDPFVSDISESERNDLFPSYEYKKRQGLKVSKWHYPPHHKLRHVLAMMHTPEGKSAWENEIFYPKLADGTKSKGYKNTYKRQWWDKPAYTITKYTSRLGSQENGHPGHVIVQSNDEEQRIWSDARTMTIFELIRLTSLPDSWDVPSKTSTNVIREILGEGVPPKLLESALLSLKQAIYERNKVQK